MDNGHRPVILGFCGSYITIIILVPGTSASATDDPPRGTACVRPSTVTDSTLTTRPQCYLQWFPYYSAPYIMLLHCAGHGVGNAEVGWIPRRRHGWTNGARNSEACCIRLRKPVRCRAEIPVVIAPVYVPIRLQLNICLRPIMYAGTAGTAYMMMMGHEISYVAPWDCTTSRVQPP